MLLCLFASLRPPPRLVCFAVLLVVVVGFHRWGRRKCRLFFGVVAVAATTVADGGLARAPTLAPATGTDSDAAAGGAINAVRNGGDQWGAWKEIQMQNVTMNQLEEQLNNECQLLGIDALHILVSIDSNLTNSGL